MERFPVLRPIFIGAVVLAVTTVIQAMAMSITVRFVARLLKGGHAGRSFWQNVGVMIVVMPILLTAHLAQVAIWAGVFVCGRALPDFETALYHSAVNFTTLGYGDIVMPPDWRLLGPIEAANGILMFGLSASAMFALTNRLLELHLKAERERHPSRAGDTHEPGGLEGKSAPG